MGSGRTPSEGRPFGPGGPQARQGLWPPHRVFLWPKSPSATSGTRPWGVSGSVAHPHSRACSTPSSEDTSHPPPPATKLTPSALCQGLLSGRPHRPLAGRTLPLAPGDGLNPSLWGSLSKSLRPLPSLPSYGRQLWREINEASHASLPRTPARHTWTHSAGACRQSPGISRALAFSLQSTSENGVSG